MDKVIGTSTVAMEKGKPESLLGNFVSDVCKAEIDSFLVSKGLQSSDIFIFNIGGLRGAFPNGNITLGDVYQVMPFDNELVWVDLSYDSLLSVVRYIREKGGAPIAGMTMKLSGVGVENVTLLNGKALNSNNSFRIGTNDFLARGGDGMNMLNMEPNIHSTGVKVLDALINHIQMREQLKKPIESSTDGRIKP
ncbi:MAG: 5'-nucleotidase C-terminal domain-containing protein [Bacteroidota bacterium]